MNLESIEDLHLEDRRIPNYIVIEGPIGVGKTSLAKRLARTFKHQLLLENTDENPFLKRFYENPRQAALATQLFFLFQRSQQIQDLRQSDMFKQAFVADYLIDKDRLFAQINLEPDELKLYEAVYDQLSIKSPTPQLVIYLQAPVNILQQRIQQRGINSEQAIEASYLEQLNESYSQFFHHYNGAPLLIVNVSQVDLINNEQDYLQFIDYALNITSGRHYFNPSFFS